MAWLAPGFGSAVFLALALAFAPASRAQEEAGEPRLVPMGTGAVTGVYYPVGVALCRLVNEGRRTHGLRCAASPSQGSVANIAALRAGDLDLAIVQSDTQNDAVLGRAGFAADGPFEDLRAVMALHSEPVTIVARADAGIAGLDDLAGRRVSLGDAGSGQRALLAELGLTTADFAADLELGPTAQARALCGGEIDAFVYAVGHPALAIQEATSTCDTVLVPAEGPAVAALLADNPFVSAATIPGGLYRGAPGDVATFGVGATLVSRAEVPDEVVHAVVRAVFEDVETLRRLNPALGPLTVEQMRDRGLSAPLHAGAARYFREQGWID